MCFDIYFTMEFKSIIMFICCFLVLMWMKPIEGEIVLVNIPDPTARQCSFPRQLEFNILRHNGDDVRLLLNTNQMVKIPGHVVLMSLDETTTAIRYDNFEIPRPSKAYHSVQGAASFVVHCHQNELTARYYYAIEGTFFHEKTKFKLQPSAADGSTGQGDVKLTYVMEEVTEFNNPEDHDFIDRGLEVPALPHRSEVGGRVPHHDREKRSTTDYFIDVLPVIDFSLYQSWSVDNGNDVARTGTAINTYITNVFTSMALRLGSLKLRNSIVLNLRMMTPHLSTSASTSPYSEQHKEVLSDGTVKIGVNKLLEEFRGWVHNTTTLPQHDHAMLFTSLDVYGGIDGEIGSNLTRGLAYIGTVCQTDGYSSSIVQDRRTYQSEPVAVHELGHGLGSNHDGDDNACDSLDRFIMSNGSYIRTDGNQYNPFVFSDCSSSAISTKIEELEADSTTLNNCLKTSIGTIDTNIVPLNAIDQCQALFHDSSYVCRGVNVPPLEDVCTSLYCFIPKTSFCRELIAATGTCCGNGKYCREGHCVTAGTGECVMDETCPLEDQPGAILEGKTCEQTHSSYCYQEDFHARCCRTCQTHKTNTPGCDFGDKQPGCKAEFCARSFSNGLKYSFICCDTCKSNFSCADQGRLSFQGTVYDCPDLINSHGKDMCYFQEIHDTFCCRTCEDVRLESDDCPYGDKSKLFNCYKLKTLNRLCTEEEKKLCCETCPTLTVVNVATDSGLPTTTASEGDTTTVCDGICGRAGRASMSLVMALSGAAVGFGVKYFIVSLLV